MVVNTQLRLRMLLGSLDSWMQGPLQSTAEVTGTRGLDRGTAMSSIVKTHLYPSMWKGSCTHVLVMS